MDERKEDSDGLNREPSVGGMNGFSGIWDYTSTLLLERYHPRWKSSGKPSRMTAQRTEQGIQELVHRLRKQYPHLPRERARSYVEVVCGYVGDEYKRDREGRWYERHSDMALPDDDMRHRIYGLAHFWGRLIVTAPTK